VRLYRWLPSLPSPQPLPDANENRIRGRAPDGTVGSASLFLGADTFIGPMYLIAGYGDDGSRAIYLFIGVP
jgi:hypothetical protein